MNSVLAGPGPVRRAGSDEVDVAKRQRASVMDRRNAKRLAGSVGCLGAAALVAAQAASASFSGSASVVQSANTTLGDLYLSVPTYGSNPGSAPPSANRIQLAVDSLYPGTIYERALDVTDAGSLALGSLTLTVSASGLTSPNGANIATDANGVKFWIQRCTADYTEAVSGGEYSYACNGGSESVVFGTSNSPAKFAQADATCVATCTLSNINTAAGATNHLRISFKLMATVPTTTQGSSFTATLTFAGTQRAGTNK